MQETWVQSLGQEEPLEKEMATHSCILTWRVPWQRSLAGYSTQGCEESDTTEATKQQGPNVASLVLKMYFDVRRQILGISMFTWLWFIRIIKHMADSCQCMAKTTTIL